MTRFVVVLLLLCVAVPAQGVIAIPAVKDNTLFQSTTGTVSDGAGVGMFCGLTSTSRKRRALVKFDVAANLPAGATVLSAQVVLECNQTNPFFGVPLPISLKRVSADWGEGTSTSTGGMGGGGSGGPATTGDATWLHRFYNTSLWTTQGGDFSAVVSATVAVDQPAVYTWAAPQLAADVQDMLNNPATNFGWGLISPETVVGDAKRFATRQEPFVPSRPRLEVTYLAPPSASATNLGGGCGPVLAASGLPTVGNYAFGLDMSSAAPGGAAYVFAAATLGAPYALGGGCFFSLDVPTATNNYLSGLFLGPVGVNGGGHAAFPVAIPPASWIHGFSILVEGVVFGASTTATNVLGLVIGT